LKKRSSNPIITGTLEKLEMLSKGQNKTFWTSVIEMVSRPNSRRSTVNVGKVSQLTKENDIVLIPGKILGDGLVDHAITVGALFMSKSAGKKIVAAGGSVLNLVEFAEKYPDGSKIIVMGG
jgi:large subunit ribosomal protein L18e